MTDHGFGPRPKCECHYCTQVRAAERNVLGPKCECHQCIQSRDACECHECTQARDALWNAQQQQLLQEQLRRDAWKHQFPDKQQDE